MSEIKGCPMWQNGTEPLSKPCYKSLCAWYGYDGECAIASIAKSLHVTRDDEGGFHALMDKLMDGDQA